LLKLLTQSFLKMYTNWHVDVGFKRSQTAIISFFCKEENGNAATKGITLAT
jgi:hypothetical protein